MLQTAGVVEARRALPGGTVSLLLTDVEASTEGWQAHPAAMAEAMSRHFELLYAAIADHRGVRPSDQGEGDSVLAAFERATDAVAAAVQAQRSLQACSWPEGVTCRVRMAIHTGESNFRGEDNYVGETVIRCARIRGLAHGGQILVSGPTRSLLPEHEFIDLGSHWLKGLDRPERVWQLAAPGLPSVFPPLRSTAVPPNTLPIAPTALLGRESTLDSLAAEVRANRLVTLTGAGGIGKTRVALELAHRLHDEMTLGARWVDLSPVRDPASVATTVLAAVGGHEDVGRTSAQLVASVIYQPMLVVLDNCEHLVDACAALVEAVIASNPHVRFLATSREALGLDGEVAWRLSSLGPHDALDLFTDRVRRARHDLELSDDALDAANQICARLDGIPLAIELAAGRCRQMSPARVAAQLDDVFRVLTGGRRTAMPRQQTLLASVEWSYDLLEPLEQVVLRHLGVFVATFELDAAEALVSGPGRVEAWAVLDVLGRLVDKNLLVAQPDDRYRLLEPVRQFCIDRLRQVDELVVARAAHVRWHGDQLAAQIPSDGALTDSSLAWVSAHYPDLTSALSWAAEQDLSAFLVMSDRLQFPWYLGGLYGDCAIIVGPVLNRLVGPDEGSVRAHLIARHAGSIALSGHRTVMTELPEAVERAFSEGDDVSGCWGAYILKLADLDAPYEFSALARRARAAGSIWGWLWQVLAARLVSLFFDSQPFDETHGPEDELREALEHAQLCDATRIQAAAILGTAEIMRGDLADAASTLYAQLAGCRRQPGVALLAASSAGAVALMRGEDGWLETVLETLEHLGRSSMDAAKAHQLLLQLRAKRADDHHEFDVSYWDMSLPPLVVMLHWLHIWSVGSEGARWAGNQPRSSRAIRIQLTDALAAGQERDARDALGLAQAAAVGAVTNGFGFLAVDALETVAWLEARAGDEAYGAMLLGAAERRRAEIGYRLRFQIHQALLSPLFELPEEIDRGRTISIGRAVELITRGERGHDQEPSSA